MWRLWHADTSGEQKLYEYPRDSLMAGDGRGGVYIICPTKGEEMWRLWHADTSGEQKLYEYPRDSLMADSDGVRSRGPHRDLQNEDGDGDDDLL